MSDWSISSRLARGDTRASVTHDPDVVASHLEDAAHYPGGHAEAVAAPRDEAGVADTLRSARIVLPIGAQSSLTGGATPMGGVVLTTHRMRGIAHVDATHVRVQAGVTLDALDRALAAESRYYPPAPTFTGAFVGGVVATNAAGAATFKYGATRDWVDALTVILSSGDVLDIERGQTRAHPDGYFDLHLSRGTVRVRVPSYRMPSVAKLSAGYFAAPGMDLIDLFVGSEGTLGVVTEVTLRVVPVRPAQSLALLWFRNRADALDLVRRLRSTARTTWQSADPKGIDVAAMEHLDRRALAVACEDHADTANGIVVPADADTALLVTLDLPAGTTTEAAFEDIARAGSGEPVRTALGDFCALVAGSAALDEVAIAVPGDPRRAAQLAAFREAVPESVNRRVGRARAGDSRIHKVAGDTVVPVERLDEFLAVCDVEFARRGLDAATWGHISDGNLHPNVIPRSFEDVDAGKAAILSIGREAIRCGGAPLAEHGVGRNPIKQQLLRDLYGDQGVEEMRRLKRALDPEGKLAPGVIFESGNREIGKLGK